MENNKKPTFAFHKDNYKFLLIGLAINLLGYLLMIGGGSDDPNKFDADALFSETRITIAPILILIGFIVIIYGIMRKPKSDSKTEEF